MSIIDTFNIRKAPTHTINMLIEVKNAFTFIKENKLWRGFWSNQWIATLSLMLSAFLSVWLFDDLFPSHLDPVGFQSNISQELTDKNGIIGETILRESKDGAISSGTKYVLLIFLEVIIFHFSVTTLNILSSGDAKPKFKEFLNAERRMIKILFQSFFKGYAANIVIGVLLGLIDMNMMRPYIMFFVYSYFIGYSFIDNYNEQFGIDIKTSLLKVRKHVGAAIALGVVVNMIIFIPLIGPFIAPIFGGVAGTLYSYKYNVQLVAVPTKMSKKEIKRIKKSGMV